MKKTMRRLSALVLAAMLAGSMTGCGSSKTETTEAAKEQTTAQAKEQAAETKGEEKKETEAAKAEPITITLWHSRGAGAQLEEMQRVVKAFNESNDKGITVEEEYVGKNTEVYSKLATSIAAGDNCQIALLGFTTVGELAAEGVLADMAPLAERDGFDLDNLLPCFNPGLYFNDQLLALPYIRSVSVLYYNKDLFKEVGCETIPTDIHEFSDVLKQIKEKTGKAGTSFYTQTDFIQGAWTKSINGIGDVSEDGLSPLSFDDGSLKEVAQWWLEGIEDGTITKYTSTEPADTILGSFYAGELAAIPYSCGNMATILKNCKESGVDVGVTQIPGFRGKATSSTGGSNMVIVGANNSDAQIEASWEFLKFLLSDEQLVLNSINTGYVPVTYSAGQNQQMIDFWKDNETYKYAYDTLEVALETYPSPYVAAWQGTMKTMWDNVILDGSMTVDEGMEYLEGMKGTIFPAN